MNEKEIQKNESAVEDNTFETDLDKCKKEREEYLDGWKRAKADLINYKKEETTRLEQFAKYVNEDFISEMITVLDNFDLSLAALEKSGPVEKGIYMIKNQIFDLLKKRGLEKIEVKIGDKFDPSVAEAVVEIKSSEVKSGAIAEIIETGYKLHNKIIRPARVKVSK